MADIPLASCADVLIAQLAKETSSAAIRNLDGQTLLGERAMLAGSLIPSLISAGGGCRLFDCIDGTVALNLSRATDRELLPALFADDALNYNDDDHIVAQMSQSHASALVARGRSIGLAIAAEHEQPPLLIEPVIELVQGLTAPATDRPPRVIDLSGLWAGPLASHLLWLAGAEVIKVESRSRPDAMRDGGSFYALLNQGKASVALDFAAAEGRRALLALISTADIVIEAARPRALEQLGINAADIVSRTPGLVWMTITAHGTRGDAANWVGFGDDCGVAAGLSAALRSVTGRIGFVGDAIADPLTGLHAAVIAWQRWISRRGGRLGVAMSHVVADCLRRTRASDALQLDKDLMTWSASTGKPFPAVTRRSIASVPELGAHTQFYLDRNVQC